MKKAIRILSCLVMLIAFTSCSGGPTPQDLIEKNSEPVYQLEAQTQMNLNISQLYEGESYLSNISTEGYVEFDEDTIHSDISSLFEMSTFHIATNLETYVDTENRVMYEKYDDSIWEKTEYNENIVDLGLIDISKITPAIFSTLKGEKAAGSYIVTGVTTIDNVVNLIDESATFISIIEDLRDLEITIVMTFNEDTLKIKTVEIYCTEDALNAFENEETKVNNLRIYMDILSYEASVEIPDEVIKCESDTEDETTEDKRTDVNHDAVYVIEEITNESRKFDIDILCLVVDDNTIELPMGVKTYLFGTEFEYSRIENLLLDGNEETEVISDDGCVIIDIYNPLSENRKAEDCKVFGVTMSLYQEDNIHSFDFFDVTEKSTFEDITALFGQPKEYCRYSNNTEYAVFVSNIGEFTFYLVNGQIRMFSIVCTRK